MIKIMLSIMTASMICTLLISTCIMISKTSMMDREKMSPFECGFDPISLNRLPFSLQFFLIAILFLIFDVEVIIILPMILSMKTSNFMMWSIIMFTFISILIMGLYYEWYNKMLEWAD